jgi:hypothetical protein
MVGAPSRPSVRGASAVKPRAVRVGWALLFSVPVGVGVGLAVARVGGGLLNPAVFGSALLFAAPLFALVYALLTVNQDDTPE